MQLPIVMHNDTSGIHLDAWNWYSRNFADLNRERHLTTFIGRAINSEFLVSDGYRLGEHTQMGELLGPVVQEMKCKIYSIMSSVKGTVLLTVKGNFYPLKAFFATLVMNYITALKCCPERGCTSQL